MTPSLRPTKFFWLPEKGSDPINAIIRRGDRWYEIMLLIAVE